MKEPLHSISFLPCDVRKGICLSINCVCSTVTTPDGASQKYTEVVVMVIVYMSRSCITPNRRNRCKESDRIQLMGGMDGLLLVNIVSCAAVYYSPGRTRDPNVLFRIVAFHKILQIKQGSSERRTGWNMKRQQGGVMNQ